MLNEGDCPPADFTGGPTLLSPPNPHTTDTKVLIGSAHAIAVSGLRRRILREKLAYWSQTSMWRPSYRARATRRRLYGAI